MFKTVGSKSDANDHFGCMPRPAFTEPICDIVGYKHYDFCVFRGSRLFGDHHVRIKSTNHSRMEKIFGKIYMYFPFSDDAKDLLKNPLNYSHSLWKKSGENIRFTCEGYSMSIPISDLVEICDYGEELLLKHLAEP
ncbi:MAG: hypothetical protein AAFN79_11345 [Pseudomonadota bacterium]